MFLLIVGSIYTLANIYVYFRGKQAFEKATDRTKRIYKYVFIFVALSFVIARTGYSFFDSVILDIFLWIGSLWTAVLMYLFIQIVLIDLVRLVMKLFKLKPAFLYDNYKMKKFFAGITVAVVAFVVVLYGFINASIVRKTIVDITLPAGNSSLTEMKIAYFSDSHFTPVNNGRLAGQIVDIVNSENPDLILLGGDLIDENHAVLERLGIQQTLRKLEAPLGVFATFGNHEYYVSPAESERIFRSSGFTVVRDTVVTLDNGLQIVARDDITKTRRGEDQRMPLDRLMQNVDRNMPVILLDHQPRVLNEAIEFGADLQISGHTHNGQLWPGNIFVKFAYELPEGYMEKEGTHFFVSSGVGSALPAVKIFSKPEVVFFNISFR